MKIDDLFDIIPLESGCYKKEPEHSRKVIKEIQEKYNISKDDMDLLEFSFSMILAVTEYHNKEN